MVVFVSLWKAIPRLSQFTPSQSQRCWSRYVATSDSCIAQSTPPSVTVVFSTVARPLRMPVTFSLRVVPPAVVPFSRETLCNVGVSSGAYVKLNRAWASPL